MSPRRAARIVLGQTFRTRRRYLSEFRQGVGDDEENYLILKEEVQNLLAVYRGGGTSRNSEKEGPQTALPMPSVALQQPMLPAVSRGEGR